MLETHAWIPIWKLGLSNFLKIDPKLKTDVMEVTVVPIFRMSSEAVAAFQKRSFAWQRPKSIDRLSEPRKYFLPPLAYASATSTNTTTIV